MTCVECGDDYLWDKSRAMLGGRRTQCGDCSEETTVKYAGVQNSDGKQAGVSILRFQSEDDRKNYIDFWQSNTGLKTGKNCQIGRGLKSTPAVSFQTVAVFEGNVNAKGKQ